MKIVKINLEDIDLNSLRKEDINYLRDLDDDYLSFKDYLFEFLSTYIAQKFESKMYLWGIDYIEIEDLRTEFSEEELQRFVFISMDYLVYDNYYIVIDFQGLIDRVIEYVNG